MKNDDRMVCDPAELVVINEDVAPYHRAWVREVPAHPMEVARALIYNLLQAEVISEVFKPVSRCTQGFFVPKPSTEGKLRLVTDYQELNHSLQRPDWPFLSNDIV